MTLLRRALRRGGRGLAALALACVGLGIGLLAWLWLTPPAPPADRPIPALPTTAGAPVRLTVLGTSLSARNDWPEALQDRLADCLGRPVSVTRVAKPGAGSTWGRQQIAAVAATRPDLVLIEFAINDADLRDGISLATSRSYHAEIIENLRSTLPDSALALMTMSPAHGLRGALRPRLASYYAALGPLADQFGIGLIDLYARWQAAPPALRRFPDGLHPGNAAVRQILLPPVSRAIATATGAPCDTQ